jgi:hypothetical protein
MKEKEPFGIGYRKTTTPHKRKKVNEDQVGCRPETSF